MGRRSIPRSRPGACRVPRNSSASFAPETEPRQLRNPLNGSLARQMKGTLDAAERTTRPRRGALVLKPLTPRVLSRRAVIHIAALWHRLFLISISPRNNTVFVGKTAGRAIFCEQVKLVILPTAEAIKELREQSKGTNAILHLTC